MDYLFGLNGFHLLRKESLGLSIGFLFLQGFVFYSFELRFFLLVVTFEELFEPLALLLVSRSMEEYYSWSLWALSSMASSWAIFSSFSSELITKIKISIHKL